MCVFTILAVLDTPSHLTPLMIVFSLTASLFIEWVNLTRENEYDRDLCTGMQEPSLSECIRSVARMSELRHRIVGYEMQNLIRWAGAAFAALFFCHLMLKWTYRHVPPDTRAEVHTALSNDLTIVLINLTAQSTSAIGTYCTLLTGSASFLIAGLCGMAGVFKYTDETSIRLINRTPAMQIVLKRRSAQWILYYIAIVLDCDMPILEALLNGKPLYPLLQK